MSTPDRSADHADQRMNDVLAAVRSVSDLEKSVVDAETGMRGFVITGPRPVPAQPVSNAIKFTPDGGRVTVRLMWEDDRAVIEVQHTGIGISQPDLQRVFQRFFRTQRATSAAIPGAGLGLTIAQAIVHGHDGHISVQSMDADGTTFRIELPHVSMLRMDGLETARRLREHAETSAARIMLLTARVTESDRERGREAGVDAQLDKPFSPAVLAQRVRALLDERPT